MTFYFCLNAIDNQQLSGLQFILEAPDGSVDQLNAVGPMNGNCFGPITFPSSHHLDALRASYTPAGVGSISILLNNSWSKPIGAQKQIGVEQIEVTQWDFNAESEFRAAPG